SSPRDGLDFNDPEQDCETAMTLYASACSLETGEWTTLEALDDCRTDPDEFWECLYDCAEDHPDDCRALDGCVGDCPGSPWISEDDIGDDDVSDDDIGDDDIIDDDTTDDDTEPIPCECACVCDIGSTRVECDNAEECGDCTSACQRQCTGLGGELESADGTC
ncbi:hypothetical protein KDL45_18110, partial [bacterium]|nr:hypothetical protein [bacterium]